MLVQDISYASLSVLLSKLKLFQLQYSLQIRNKSSTCRLFPSLNSFVSYEQIMIYLNLFVVSVKDFSD